MLNVPQVRWCSPPLEGGVRGGVHKSNPSPSKNQGLAKWGKSGFLLPLPEGERSYICPQYCLLIRAALGVSRAKQHAMEALMTIKTGDKIPSVTLKQLTASGMQDLSTDSVFGNKKVVLFAVPGAFTPTCSAKHLPGFVEKAGELKKKGVDAVACLSVNDA